MRIKQEIVNQDLKSHSTWVRSNRRVGKRADFGGEDLRGMTFYVDLREVNFTKSDLRGVNLREANLRDSDLSFADLRDTDLSGADLSMSNTNGAIYNDKTIFPEGFLPEEHSMMLGGYRFMACKESLKESLAQPLEEPVTTVADVIEEMRRELEEIEKRKSFLVMAIKEIQKHRK